MAARAGKQRSLPDLARVAPGEVRIIGGRWKRSRVSVADRPGLRPTPSRVRETLFNWLGQDLSGWRCVDAFAGSGALGFEAASRGAADVMICEQDLWLIAELRKLQQRLDAETVRIVRTDGLAALRGLSGADVDLVFLDPPFDAGLYPAALAAAGAAIDPQRGRIYLEAPAIWRENQLAEFGLILLKHLHAGNVHAHLLNRAT